VEKIPVKVHGQALGRPEEAPVPPVGNDPEREELLSKKTTLIGNQEV
jgi:hypothetical protein